MPFRVVSGVGLGMGVLDQDKYFKNLAKARLVGTQPLRLSELMTFFYLS